MGQRVQDRLAQNGGRILGEGLSMRADNSLMTTRVPRDEPQRLLEQHRERTVDLLTCAHGTRTGTHAHTPHDLHGGGLHVTSRPRGEEQDRGAQGLRVKRSVLNLGDAKIHERSIDGRDAPPADR